MHLVDFDADDYLMRYPEVAALGMDAREHFEKFGKRLGYVDELQSPLYRPSLASSSSHVVRFWNFVTTKPYGEFNERDFVHAPVSVNWFMPPMSPNSGGHINIFRFLLGLQNKGFKCNVIIVNNGVYPYIGTSSEMIDNINSWYGEFTGNAYILEEGIPSSTISIATGWQTAFSVANFEGSPLKYYFVQDYEPLFYPAGSEATFAEQTYRLGLTAFTAGTWLADKLKKEYHMRTYALSFSYDRKLYSPTARRDTGNKNVFCYVRPETARRGWELTLLALTEVHSRFPDVQFILAGGQIDASTVPFPALIPGALPTSELADLYSQCDVALVVSLTNLSLLPLELMACGVPVVSNGGPNVTWMLSGSNAEICKSTPQALADGIATFITKSPEESSLVRQQCRKFAETTDWNSQIDKMHAILLEQTTVLQSGKWSFEASADCIGHRMRPQHEVSI